jgi:hypothetical protein
MKMITPLQRKSMLVGRSIHQRFTPLESVARPDWVGEMVSEAPVKAAKAIAALETANIRICHTYLLHEAPKLLNAPKEEPVKSDFKIPNILPDADVLTEIILVIVRVFAMVFLSAIFLDPAVVVELEDGSFLEIMSWYD